MADVLRIDLVYQGNPMQILTDFELSPFLCADPEVPAQMVDAVSNHMDKCRIKGPLVVARMRSRFRAAGRDAAKLGQV
jgi:hypothetical protein